MGLDYLTVLLLMRRVGLFLKMAPANKPERCDGSGLGGGSISWNRGCRNPSGVSSFGKFADDSDESAVLVL